MRKIFVIIIIFFLLGIVFIPRFNNVYAANTCSDIQIKAVDYSNNTIYSPFSGGSIKRIEYSFRVNQTAQYKVYADDGIWGRDYLEEIPTATNLLTGTITKSAQFDTGNHKLSIEIKRADGTWDKFLGSTCDNLTYSVKPAPPPPPVIGCSLKIDPGPPSIIKTTTPVTISGSTGIPDLFQETLTVYGNGQRKNYNIPTTINGTNFTSTSRTWNDDLYTVLFTYWTANPDHCFDCQILSCSTQFAVNDVNGGWITPTVSPLPTPTDDPNICNSCSPSDCSNSVKPQCGQCSFCLPTIAPVQPLPSLAQLCDQLPTENNYSTTCWNCVNTGGIWTAIGCLPTNLEVILKDYVFVYGTGITGGIAFLYFIYGAFLILTSGGNPEKIAEGKEIIISALSGLFLIIFSVFLLRVIGYDILKLPGFS